MNDELEKAYVMQSVKKPTRWQYYLPLAKQRNIPSLLDTAKCSPAFKGKENRTDPARVELKFGMVFANLFSHIKTCGV